MAQPIKVFEPRYHDNTVLLAKYRLPKDADVTVEIVKGAYQGKYKVEAKDIAEAEEAIMLSKLGKLITLKAVKLDKLIRIEEK